MKQPSHLSWEKIAKETKLDKKSIENRKKILDVVNASRRGHIGSAFSSVDIVKVLYDHFLHVNPQNPQWADRDRFLFSKGHGCLSLYTVLAQKGFFRQKDLYTFCKFGSKFGGHPQYGKVPGVEASTGSLGHGLSIALGIALSAKIKKKKWKTIILISDGECNEGSTWEAALSVSKHRLDNLLVLVDYNKMQSYGKTYEVLDLEPFRNKWASFGFKAEEVNGHDRLQLKSCISSVLKNLDGPAVIICHTIKGKGIPFIEQNPFWHHKSMITDEEMGRLYRELGEK